MVHPPRRMTVLEVLRLSTGYLEEKGIESPRLTAEILLAHLLGCQRIDIYLWFDRPMEEHELATMRRYLRCRTDGIPVDYIIRKAEFYGLSLLVDPRVMIPRPETEVLVEKVLGLVEECTDGPNGREGFLFLELGTGSGAISLAILNQLPGSHAVATDISLGALRVACANALALELSYRFRPILGDLYQPIRGNGRFDLIVSNPPYVSDGEIDSLPREVREHEPRVALTAGPDGLSFIRRIVEGAGDKLKPGGLLGLEIGYRQGGEVVELVNGQRDLQLIALEKDLNGIERIVLARKEEG